MHAFRPEFLVSILHEIGHNATSAGRKRWQVGTLWTWLETMYQLNTDSIEHPWKGHTHTGLKIGGAFISHTPVLKAGVKYISNQLVSGYYFCPYFLWIIEAFIPCSCHLLHGHVGFIGLATTHNIGTNNTSSPPWHLPWLPLQPWNTHWGWSQGCVQVIVGWLNYAFLERIYCKRSVH